MVKKSRRHCQRWRAGKVLMTVGPAEPQIWSGWIIQQTRRFPPNLNALSLDHFLLRWIIGMNYPIFTQRIGGQLNQPWQVAWSKMLFLKRELMTRSESSPWWWLKDKVTGGRIIRMMMTDRQGFWWQTSVVTMSSGSRANKAPTIAPTPTAAKCQDMGAILSQLSNLEKCEHFKIS